MKKIISISICAMVLVFVISIAYAQMGGGKSGSMMGGQGHMAGMMQGHEVTGNMVHHMGQMSRLMQQLRDMISEKPDAENMKRLSGMMEDMSEHFKRMSTIMKKGDVSEKEMHELDQHNRMMQQAYEKMRW